MAQTRSTGAVPATGIAPSLGVVLAGVALAASMLPWTGQPQIVTVGGVEGSGLAAGFALVATIFFVLRRHGALPETAGSPVAGLLCLGVAVLAVYRLVTPALGEGSAPTVGLALPVAALAGLGGASIAVADWLAMPDAEVWAKLRATAVALVVGFLGFVVSQIIASAVALIPLSLTSTSDLSVAYPVLTVGSGIGLGLFTLGYLRYRDLDVDYIDVSWPDLQAVVYGIGGLIVLYLSAAGISFLFAELGLPTAESSIQQFAERLDEPVFLLALIPLSWLAIGPGEELVYRNVVQKYLYEAFSRRTAVVVASVIFGAIHFQQYANPNPVATLSTLFVVFVLSVVLGYSYYKTENLLVPIFIHGTWNAFQFFALYYQLTNDVPML